MALEFTDANFQAEALDSEKAVIVDFWAEWCGPCKMVGPVVEQIAKDYDGKAVVGKLNVDQNPETAMKYGIRSIPTILFLKGGEIVDRQVGTVSRDVLIKKLEAQMA
ncbi:MAG: thioredoxin [Crocinitomicaceae bacterium]|nr:thioredoxin [Crocinitomicaceae bacterium]|tara:strand:+ start:31348 stop:31668 length:321 start_codon:yes stop_codon:yes gene_type:complete